MFSPKSPKMRMFKIKFRNEMLVSSFYLYRSYIKKNHVILILVDTSCINMEINSVINTRKCIFYMSKIHIKEENSLVSLYLYILVKRHR